MRDPVTVIRAELAKTFLMGGPWPPLVAIDQVEELVRVADEWMTSLDAYQEMKRNSATGMPSIPLHAAHMERRADIEKRFRAALQPFLEKD